MDSDDLFGSSSVWATSSSTPHQPAQDIVDDFDAPITSTHADAGFDDFDDFNEPAPGDDDFGDDFGDFGEAQEPPDATEFVEHVAPASLVAEPDTMWAEAWHPLQLEPFPSPNELSERIEELLGSIYDSSNLSRFLSDEGIRQAEGLNQTLVTPESRLLFQSIFATYPPATRPPDWIRSRIRRQHLISLGIPINLDEVLPQANGKPMPELQITTRPASTPPADLGKRSPAVRNAPGSSYPSRSGTPQPQLRAGPASAAQSLSLGPKPTLDRAKVNAMLDLETDSLSLLPLTKLQSHLVTIRNLTSDASALLTHLLQTKDALQQDSETYNGLIGELVSEATRSKISQRGGRAGPKRSSAF